MKHKQEWVDHPDTPMKKTTRPHLKLVVTPPEAPPDSPTDKAVNTMSDKAELFLAILAQSALILGLFMASNILN